MKDIYKKLATAMEKYFSYKETRRQIEVEVEPMVEIKKSMDRRLKDISKLKSGN